MRNEVKLELNGKTYNLPFGLGFLGECLENLGMDVHQIGQKLDDNPFMWIPKMILESHKYECLLNDTKPEFTYRELVEWLDNPEGQKKMNSYLIAFVEGLSKNLPKSDAKGGAKKK